jgi:hypothetical protein
MPVVALCVGACLITLAVLGFLAGGGGEEVRSALIPAAPGVLILLCGLIGLKGGGFRKHSMHVAALVALLGVLATVPPMLTRVIPGEASGLAIASLVGMLVLCLTFLVAAIRSFIVARKARRGEPTGLPSTPG